MKKFLAGSFLAIFALLSMSIVSETVIGPQPGGDNVLIRQRAGREGQTISADLTGKFAEATSRGQVFTATTAVAGVTVAATHVTPLAAGTGTPILGLFNPPGSGKNLEILKVQAAWVSGTTGAGGLVFNVAFAQNISVAGNTVPRSNLVGGANTVALAFTNTATTGSTIGLLFRALNGCTVFAGAIAATTVGLNCGEEVEGSIVVPPGGYFAIAAGLAGTSPIVQAAITYREAIP